MTKLSRAVLALAAGLLSTGALAQTAAFMADEESVTVPAELFGPEAVELAFSAEKGFEPKAKLILRQVPTAVSTDTKFSVSYSLGGGMLDEEVSNTNFMWGYWGPADASAATATAGCMDPATGEEVTAPDATLTRLVFCPLPDEVTVEREGGAKGTSSVTFDVSIATEITTGTLVYPMKTDADGDATTPDVYAETDETRKIVLVLPNVEATGEVSVTMDVSQPTTGGRITAISGDLFCVLKEGEDPAVSPMCSGKVVVVNAHAVLGDAEADPKVPAITSTGMDGTISLEDRTMLVDADDDGAIQLATFKVNSKFIAGLKDADGNDLEAEDGFDGTLAGNMEIYVESESFRDGDKLKAGTVDMVVKDTVATATVELSDAAADAGVAVTYQPNGKDNLQHRTMFDAHAETLFDDENHKDAASAAVMSTLTLEGIMPETAKAYAIAPMTSTDIANVRVTCEASSGCQVFLDCKDMDGMSTFYEDGAELMGGETVRWTQSDIAAALGIDWTDWLACEVLSTKSVSVQVLTRAAGVLVNNTYVDET